MNTKLQLLFLSTACVLGLGSESRAQCLEWDQRFGLAGLFSGAAEVSIVFDDGSGPALFVGGGFQRAGNLAVQNVAKWDGSSWSALGAGVNGVVEAFAVFDDGSGDALYAAGWFTTAGGGSANRIAKWNGTSWSPLGSGMSGGEGVVQSLCVFDDGTGPALYAGGQFATAGGLTTDGIAKWNGTSWSDPGAPTQDSDACIALAVFDDGGGPELYAGGLFSGPPARFIYRWDGSVWTPMLGSVDDIVRDLLVFDDGSGDALYASGDFSTAGGVISQHIAKWNGTSWSGLAGGTNDLVEAMAGFDDGGGPALYAGGMFTTAGGVSANYIAKWNGTGWAALGSGVVSIGPYPKVTSLRSFDDGGGAKLYVGGFFDTVGGSITAHRVATWDGGSWAPLNVEMGVYSAFVHDIRALTVFDDGTGPAVYAGGYFKNAGAVSAARVAKWNGTSWSALAEGVGGGSSPVVHALAVYDDGTGPALYAGGVFLTAGAGTGNNIAKWNGTSWSSVGNGTNNTVYALAVHDDGSGPALYVGGEFTAATGVAASRIARWNGTSWSAVGLGLNNIVKALAVHDDGFGPSLYAGGHFILSGPDAVDKIARWTGSSWVSVGGGMDSHVYALHSFDDGGGAKLYATGVFTIAGGSSASQIAAWNGTSWSTLGTGLGGGGNCLTTFDDGSGPALYVGGGFTTAGGASAKRIARWDGTWSALGGGLSPLSGSSAVTYALTTFEDDADGATDLYVGGSFDIAESSLSMAFAEWHGCPPGQTYCFGDGLDPVVTAQCPCANFGDPGHGCANSNPALGGARLWASGTTSPNTLLFTCEGINNNALATFWRGTANTPTGGVVHDGIQCLGGTTIRFGQQFAGQLGNPPNTITSGTVAMPPGSTRYYQVLYRNPAPGFCPPGQYNWSNGYIVTW